MLATTSAKVADRAGRSTACSSSTVPESTNPYAVQSRQPSRGSRTEPRNDSGTRINTLQMNSTRLGSASGPGRPRPVPTSATQATLLLGTSADGLSRTNARKTAYAASATRAVRR